MGVNQSNTKFDNMEGNFKPSNFPVVLPADKLHSSSSISTTASSSSDSADGFKAREAWYADREMLANLLSSYESSTVLGKGSSAQVFQVVHKETGETFACKIVRKSHMNDENTMSLETEIMMRAKHENIIRLHELYETSSSRWFIMELANSGTLQTALAEEANYTEDLVAGLFKQVLSGVKHLHDMGIVHRDLKQDNILCALEETATGEKKYVAKIADFGLSAVVDTPSDMDAAKMEKKMKSFHKLKDMWGTKEYFAPEVYKKAYGPQVDVWSLGCVLYELLTGVSPFPEREKTVSMFEKYVLNGGKKMSRIYQFRPEWNELSADAQDLINRMLKVSPTKRFSIQECLNHPYIRNVRDNATVRTSEVCFKKFMESASGKENVSPECAAKVQVVVANKLRGKVLTGARGAAVKSAEMKVRRLKLLAGQIEKDMKERQ